MRYLALLTLLGWTCLCPAQTERDACTSTWDPEGMSWMMIPVTLNEGYKNTVTIQAFDDLWGPNFDRITIHSVLSDEEVTGIGGFKNEDPPTPFRGSNGQFIYDLEGRLIAYHTSDIAHRTLPKGLYISEGKKIAIR